MGKFNTIPAHTMKYRLVLLFIMTQCFSACTLWRIIYFNASGIDDYKIFSARKLTASSNPFQFIENSGDARIPARAQCAGQDVVLDELLAANRTVAFLILKHDTLLFEKYYQGHSDTALSLSFSMAKSFLSMLIGCAIDDGLIRSVAQPVTDFVPELKKNGFDRVTIEHLLQMTSGMDYAEPGFPLGLHSHFYYGQDLEQKILKLKIIETPGTRFRYKSGDNQLLGLILARVLNPKTITEYMQEKIWEPLGMAYDGLWSTDHDQGLEKTFCCLAARARDFLKLGRLYLNEGNWNGRQIVSGAWVKKSTAIDASNGSSWKYRYQWWLVSKTDGDYMAAGHLGQYLYIHPKKNIVILRLGTGRGQLKSESWQELFRFLASAI